MPMMPSHILGMWSRGFLSLVPLGAGVYALFQAAKPRCRVHKDTLAVRVPADALLALDRQFRDDRVPTEGNRRHALKPEVRGNRRAAFLLGGLALLSWSFGGGRAAKRLFRRGITRSVLRRDFVIRWLQRPDGTKLHARCAGPSNGTAIIFVHGLGADGDEWYEIREQLVDRYRVIDWDLPGLGKSTMPPNRDWILETLARDLEAILSLTEGRPAVLVGHSLGGMILLTFCRLFPQAMGSRVSGLVLAHTTYTNPVKTTACSRVHTALQKPVLEPLCYLTIRLAPLVRQLCILSYLNGSAHRDLQRSLFTGRESWDLLDFLARYYLRDCPDVVARGMLAMFRYDETKTLETIHVPTLVVSGDQDPHCATECQSFLCDRIPGAQRLTLSPAKHGGLLEYPLQFVQALEQFVSRCEQRIEGVPSHTNSAFTESKVASPPDAFQSAPV